MRAGVESFHKVRKSGCTVEDGRLEDAARLPPLTLMRVIAWRLVWLTSINRHTPEAPYTAILAEHEWHARNGSGMRRSVRNPARSRALIAAPTAGAPLRLVRWVIVTFSTSGA